VSDGLLNFLLGLLLAPAVALTMWNLGRTFSVRIHFIRSWLSGCVGGASGCIWAHDWSAWGLGALISALVALAIWWWRRRKRRNVAALIGAKSRALRDAIVRKAREAARPRPVLRPAPVPR
jgi:hypothetical protein